MGGGSTYGWRWSLMVREANKNSILGRSPPLSAKIALVKS